MDVTASLDLSKAKRVLQKQKRVNVDFPTWMIDSLDREVSKLGVTRQSVIKVWLAERLEATIHVGKSTFTSFCFCSTRLALDRSSEAVTSTS